MLVVPLYQDVGVPPLPAHPIIGRAGELAELTETALGDRGAPSITLLGGDAGVGKTRLLTELYARADAAGVRVLLGHCLNLGESGAPYLPVTEMFARVARDSPDLLADLVGISPLLGPLLPDQPGTDLRAPIAGDRSALFDAVHLTLTRLSAEARVVMIVEDAHWADRSTREMLTFLFSRGFTGPVSIVVTYRTDDLHRRHPLRPALAEWSRIPGVHRMMLGPLVDADVRALIEDLRPGVASADDAAIVRRSGGNPFFVEELLAAAELDTAGLPEQLADLLLVRIDALSDEARTVVRSASVAGRAVGHDLLSAVVELPPDELDAGLRVLVDNHVFVMTGTGGYAFRHALLAEAVYDDLLPGERVRIHQRFARALDGRTGVGVSAALARHARAAGDRSLAAIASQRAGDEAMAAVGPADAARHYEDALELAAEGAGADAHIDRVSLLCRATRALIAAGNPHRAAELADDALVAHTGSLVERATLVASLMDAQLLIDRPLMPYSIAEDAIGWLAQEPPSPVLARLQASLARARIIEDDFDGAVLLATEGLALARELGQQEVVTDLMTTLARLDDFAGDPDRAIASLREVIERARAGHDVAAELRGLHQLGRVLARGDDLRAAAEVHQQAARRSVETGRPTEPFAMDARVTGAILATVIGEWTVADELLDMSHVQLPPFYVALFGAVQTQLDVQRGIGDPIAAVSKVRPLWPQDMFLAIHSASATIDALGFAGDLEEMFAAYDELAATIQSVWHMREFDATIRLSAMAIGHLATAVAHRGVDLRAYDERVDAMMATVADVVGARRSEELLGAESQAWLMRARAEERRYRSSGSSPELIAAWRAAVERNDAAKMPYEAAWCRIHLAEALQGAGERAEARERRDQARETADRLGSKPLQDALGGTPRATAGEAVLTPREREVLALVADGRSNGAIAKALFISTKTASVHVSNILGKIDAASRTEAVAIARRRGLLT